MPKVSTAHEQQQRERILRAATLCFCRLGYHETTVSDICEEAALSKGGLYTYFKSKEELLSAVVQESFAATLGRAEAAAQGGGNALERLDRVAEAVIEALNAEETAGLQSPQLVLEMWAEASKNPQLNALFMEGHTRWRTFLTSLLREGIAQGVFKPDVDPDALVTILLAVFDGLNLHEGVTRSKIDWRHTVETLRRGLIEGIVRRTDAVRG